MKNLENNFMIALNGVKLTDEQKKKINSGIQEIVMKELAQLDHTEMIVKKEKGIELTSLIKDRPFIWGLLADFKNSVINIKSVQEVR